MAKGGRATWGQRSPPHAPGQKHLFCAARWHEGHSHGCGAATTTISRTFSSSQAGPLRPELSLPPPRAPGSRETHAHRPEQGRSRTTLGAFPPGIYHSHPTAHRDPSPGPSAPPASALGQETPGRRTVFRGSSPPPLLPDVGRSMGWWDVCSGGQPTGTRGVVTGLGPRQLRVSGDVGPTGRH